MIKQQESHISNIQFNYYKKIREQVDHVLGESPAELKSYTWQYENELKKATYKPVNSTQFFKAIEKAHILLVGDFHAQPQSARALLRICRKLGAGRIVLALECFRSVDQKAIDLYMAGDISEQEFLKSIEWKKNWGFPWEPTRTLMKWAVQHAVPVYGINLSGKNKKLKKRDQHFSQNLYQLHMKHPQKIVVTQVGDFHLAKKHLPLDLKKNRKKISVHSVFQSPDALYFKALQKKKDAGLQKNSDFFQLSENRWALMTVVPWVKWQDYLLYLESGWDKSVSTDDVSEIDITDHVDKFVHLMSHSLKMTIDNTNLSVYHSQDPQVSKMMKRLDTSARRKVKKELSSGVSMYIPELELGVVSRLTVNHISRVAAQFIMFKLGVFNKTLLDVKNNFLKLIWFEMLTYFMSKMANPKRKTDTLSDIRAALSNADFEDSGRQTLSLALEQKMREIQYINTGSLPKARLRKSTFQSYAVASGILGGVLGEKVFYALNKKLIKFPAAQGFLFKKIEDKNFETLYYDAIEVIDSWPVPFHSKYDQF